MKHVWAVAKIDKRYSRGYSSIVYNSNLMTFTKNIFDTFSGHYETHNEADLVKQIMQRKNKKLKLKVILIQK